MGHGTRTRGVLWWKENEYKQMRRNKQPNWESPLAGKEWVRQGQHMTLTRA